MTDEAAEREVTFKASDGWQISGLMHIPHDKRKVPGVVLVHSSRHEGDAYGNVTAPGLLQTLSRQGVATLRIDIRGRGASREPREFHSLAPEQRAAVRLDIEAAINFLAAQSRVDVERIGIVSEQDTANSAVIASAGDARVTAHVIISGRLSDAAKKALAATTAPVFCLVSKEDRRAFKDMTDAYLLSKSELSRLKVYEGLPFGTTMFSAWRFEFPKEQPLDQMAGACLAERLKINTRAGAKRGGTKRAT